MTLRSVLQAIARSWFPALVVLLVCTIAGLTVGLLSPTSYQTRTQLLFQPTAITAPEEGEAALPAVAASVQAQLPTYATLAETATVLEPAADALRDGTTAQQLGRRIEASVVDDTAVITITASGATGRQAAEAANAVALALIDEVAELDPTGTGAGAITGQVVEAPIVPGSPQGPGLLLDVVVGLLVGLVLAYLVVVAREALRPPQLSRA